MKDLIKKEYKSLILVACYIIVAELVYIVLFNSFFKEKVWVTILVAFGVFLLGCLFGFLYIKDDIKEKNKKEATALASKEEIKEDIKVEEKEEIIEENNDEKPE